MLSERPSFHELRRKEQTLYIEREIDKKNTFLKNLK